MVKIDILKVIGSNTEETTSRNQSILHQFTLSSARSRIFRLSPRTLWPLLATALFVQSFICWRFFFPPRPSYVSGPPYNVTETVALITEWYQVLQDMRYLGKDSIAYPPHADEHGESTVNITLAREFGLDELVIETMLQMPYVDVGSTITTTDKHRGDNWWSGWMGNRGILWRNGHFVDYRNNEDLWLALDPLMTADHSFSPDDVARMTLPERIIELEAIPKSVVPLSLIRNPRYGLVLLLDVATNRLLVYDTQGGNANSDPFFERRDMWATMPNEYKIPGRFYGMENIYARHAPDVLRELITKTVNLETGYIPGSVRTDEHYSPELSPPIWERWVRELYYECGWPGPKTLQDCHYPSFSSNSSTTCPLNPLDSLDVDMFDIKMANLRYDITVKYLPDWYCPVPRDPDVVSRLQNSLHRMTEEQVTYALSDEPVIPLDLNGWGGSLIWQTSWEDPE